MEEERDQILVAVKTPLMPRAATFLLSQDLTLAQSLAAILEVPPTKDETAGRVLQQLKRETSDGTPYSFLAVEENGRIFKADPETSLADISVNKEIRTARGLEIMPLAAFEVQSYARVGGFCSHGSSSA